MKKEKWNSIRADLAFTDAERAIINEGRAKNGLPPRDWSQPYVPTTPKDSYELGDTYGDDDDREPIKRTKSAYSKRTTKPVVATLECPSCHKERPFTTRVGYRIAVKTKTMCSKCGWYNRKQSH